MACKTCVATRSLKREKFVQNHNPSRKGMECRPLKKGGEKNPTKAQSDERSRKGNGWNICTGHDAHAVRLDSGEQESTVNPQRSNEKLMTERGGGRLRVRCKSPDPKEQFSVRRGGRRKLLSRGSASGGLERRGVKVGNQCPKGKKLSGIKRTSRTCYSQEKKVKEMKKEPTLRRNGFRSGMKGTYLSELQRSE